MGATNRARISRPRTGSAYGAKSRLRVRAHAGGTPVGPRVTVRSVNALLLQFVVWTLAGWIQRGQRSTIDYLVEENWVLREQLGKRRVRLTDDQRRRLAMRAKALGRAALSDVAGIVTPDTLLRWYRNLVARKYDGSQSRTAGRPRTAVAIARLVVRMATENPGWGYTRIRGALYNLGHDIGRNTIKRVLTDAGLEPAPERGRSPSWKTFLDAHWDAIAAVDFFAVEVLTLTGLVRHFVLFVIDVRSRRVQIAGVTHHLSSAWMAQIARNLTDRGEGFLRDARYLIHDRDPMFTRQFIAILKAAGVETVKLPARSPNLNAYAERWVRTIRQECLCRIIPLGEAHLRRTLREFVEHYERERNHQGVDNRLLIAAPMNNQGPVQRRERLGGTLNFYYRQAA
jgi:putative transposase